MVIKIEDKRSFDSKGELKETLNENKKNEAKTKEALKFPPPPSFSDFILSLYASAMMAMGAIEIKGSPKVEVDLAQAKQTIDILEILLKKTEGNLSEEEKNLFDTVLTELRLNFVNNMKKL